MFLIGEQPDFVKDLKNLEDIPNEIAIQGKTKNLELLSKFRNIGTVWVFTVNQKEFDLIINSINPKTLYIYEMRVEDLSSLRTT